VGRRRRRESGESAELRERPDGDALRGVRLLQEIAAGTSLDVIEIDAASNRGIDQIRELREMVRYAPAALEKQSGDPDEAPHAQPARRQTHCWKTLEETAGPRDLCDGHHATGRLVDTIRSSHKHFHFAR